MLPAGVPARHPLEIPGKDLALPRVHDTDVRKQSAYSKHGQTLDWRRRARVFRREQPPTISREVAAAVAPAVFG